MDKNHCTNFYQTVIPPKSTDVSAMTLPIDTVNWAHHVIRARENLNVSLIFE